MGSFQRVLGAVTIVAQFCASLLSDVENPTGNSPVIAESLISSRCCLPVPRAPDFPAHCVPTPRFWVAPVSPRRDGSTREETLGSSSRCRPRPAGPLAAHTGRSSCLGTPPPSRGEDRPGSGAGQGPDDVRPYRERWSTRGQDRLRSPRGDTAVPGGRTPGPRPTAVSQTTFPKTDLQCHCGV